MAQPLERWNNQVLLILVSQGVVPSRAVWWSNILHGTSQTEVRTSLGHLSPLSDIWREKSQFLYCRFSWSAVPFTCYRATGNHVTEDRLWLRDSWYHMRPAQMPSQLFHDTQEACWEPAALQRDQLWWGGWLGKTLRQLRNSRSRHVLSLMKVYCCMSSYLPSILKDFNVYSLRKLPSCFKFVSKC